MICVLAASLMAAAPMTDGGISQRLGPMNPVDLFAQVSPSCVTIKTETGRGSGVVIGKDLIATNAHVVRGSMTVNVTQAEVQWGGAVIASDEKLDVALVAVKDLPRPAVRLRALSTLKTGERVYAIGAPYGLEQTLSEGLISAVRLKGSSDATPIQTTAPISSGSSGGGLFDAFGRLVGLTTSGRNQDPGSSVPQNLNFAVPTDWIEAVRRAPSPSAAPAQSGAAAVGAPTFSVVRRPEALGCTPLSRRWVGVFSEGNEVLSTERVNGSWYVENFHRDVARIRFFQPYDLDPIELVLADMSRSDGVALFAATESRGQVARFGFNDASGVISLAYFEPATIKGQPRLSVWSAVCVPMTTKQLQAKQDELDGKAAAQRKADIAAANARMNQKSAIEECDSGNAALCVALAEESAEKGDAPQAANLFRKACGFGTSKACVRAHALYRSAGSAARAEEMRAKGCALGECPR